MKKVKFLNVGHGDCSVIYFLRKRQIVATVIIDIPNSEKLLMELKKSGVREIDYLIISHSDADHCKGVSDFLDKFLMSGTVKRIVFNYDKKKVTRIQSLMLKKMLEVNTQFNVDLVSGTISNTREKEKVLIKVDNEILSIIYPNVQDEIIPYLSDNTNNFSIVCYLRGEKSNIIFPGDLEAEGWKSLLMRNPSLNCDILKMPHHGGYWNIESSIDDILVHLSPKEAVISSRENKVYKHPRIETIQCLKKNSVKIYCTQYTSLCNAVCNGNCICNGDIQIIEDAKGYTMKCEANNIAMLSAPQCV